MNQITQISVSYLGKAPISLGGGTKSFMWMFLVNFPVCYFPILLTNVLLASGAQAPAFLLLLL